jgi:hypothetical protein
MPQGLFQVSRSIFVLIAILCVSSVGIAKQEDILDKTKDVIIDEPADKIEDFFDDESDNQETDDNLDREQHQRAADPRANECRQEIIARAADSGSPIVVTMEELQENPSAYYGKTVTVEGEMHRTFTDHVFTIEDDGFWSDHDVLIISTVPKSDAVVALEDSIESGTDVRVTGLVEPYDRGKLECAYGPLRLESREGHSFTKNPVLVVERSRPVQAVQREKPAPPLEVPEPQPAPEPAPAPAPMPSLPKTAGELPLLALAGLLALSAAFVMRRHRVS